MNLSTNFYGVSFKNDFTSEKTDGTEESVMRGILTTGGSIAGTRLRGRFSYDPKGDHLLTSVAITVQKSINNDFTNMSVLFLEYGEFCKSLIDTPEIRNQYWINKAFEKYK